MVALWFKIGLRSNFRASIKKKRFLAESVCPMLHAYTHHSPIDYIYLYFTIFLIVENVQLTSDKNGRFTCHGQEVTFTCCVLGSSSLEWRNSLITGGITYTAVHGSGQVINRDYFATSLTDISKDNTSTLNTNFTSTLRVNASRMFIINQTTILCTSTADNKTDTFTIAGKSYN